MREGGGEKTPPQTPGDALEMWLGYRSAGDLQPQAWVTDDGRFAIRWFGDRPPIILVIGDEPST